MKTYTEEEIKILCAKYLYYTTSHIGAMEFMELERTGKIKTEDISGTTRAFRYVFKDFCK